MSQRECMKESEWVTLIERVPGEGESVWVSFERDRTRNSVRRRRQGESREYFRERERERESLIIWWECICVVLLVCICTCTDINYGIFQCGPLESLNVVVCTFEWMCVHSCK